MSTAVAAAAEHPAQGRDKGSTVVSRERRGPSLATERLALEVALASYQQWHTTKIELEAALAAARSDEVAALEDSAGDRQERTRRIADAQILARVVEKDLQHHAKSEQSVTTELLRTADRALQVFARELASERGRRFPAVRAQLREALRLGGIWESISEETRTLLVAAHAEIRALDARAFGEHGYFRRLLDELSREPAHFSNPQRGSSGRT
jgi:hypothetical protein